MELISVAQIQELVSQLPENKLPDAYRLLRDLAQRPSGASLQAEFMRLPLSERRLLREQAGEMEDYYRQTAAERQDWQSGDFQDEH